MYIYTAAPKQPRPVMGTDAVSQVANPTNWARIALVAACGIGAFALYRKAIGQPIMPNFLPPWPGIGPIFSYSAGMGPAYALTPFIV